MKPCRGLAAALLLMLATAGGLGARERWTKEKANAWYQERGFLVGANFIPSTAINQLEMWQADTFDPDTIDREIGLASSLGFTSVRVFLHHLLWEQDRDGFLERVDRFLAICDRHGVGVMIVLLDGVWDPNPKLGKQREPRPHVHNSGWVQSPGAAILGDPRRHDELRGYVYDIVRHYRDDRRIHAWDVFNEPDNRNDGSYPDTELKDKPEKAAMLLKKVFRWAREAEPSQPLTAGVWLGPWPAEKPLAPIEALMLEESDVVSFHAYEGLEGIRERVSQLRRYGRPILCTEYMARPRGSRFEPLLRYFKDEKVAAYNWGFVSGKSQTIYPWDSWSKPYTAEPAVWFHDIFRPDGTPFDPSEIRYIRSVLRPVTPR
ncbi:MAG TPA: endo-1,4-beta-xylanase [Vicinamibacteria bacterium]